MMSVNLPDNPSVTQRVAIGQRLAAAIRREGRRNIQVLPRIQEELTSEGIERTLIRIFDDRRLESMPGKGTLRVVVVDVNSGRIGSVTVPSNALEARP